MLDLVDDGALAKLRDEAAGIGFGEVSLVGRFEVDVPEMRKSRAAECRLAGLARPGDGHEGVLSEERCQADGNFALDHGR